MDECNFTCFEHDCGDNVIFEDNTLSIEQLEQFQDNTNHHVALEKIAKYMNANIEDLKHHYRQHIRTLVKIHGKVPPCII